MRLAQGPEETGTMELDGKVALVTGSGIGKATALLMARAGARVGALSLPPPVQANMLISQSF